MQACTSREERKHPEMKLVTINVKGIYGKPGSSLPASMARLTPDAAQNLAKVEAEIEARGGCFRLSDAYRSSAMQARAHDDYVRGRKRAYSPPAGSSMHEAGRAIDVDLAALINPSSVPKGSQTLNELVVRSIFESFGWTFIAPAGNPHLVDVSESWHVEYRGRFQAVYDAVLRKTGSRSKAYHSMAAAAIADLNVPAPPQVAGKPLNASIQTSPPNPLSRDHTTTSSSGSNKPADAIEHNVPDHSTDIAADSFSATDVDHTEGLDTKTDQSSGPDSDSSDRATQPNFQAGITSQQQEKRSTTPHIGERLRSSTTFLQSLGIQISAVGAAAWGFVSSNTKHLLYILCGSACVSLVVYAIYTWKEVQTKRLEAGRR